MKDKTWLEMVARARMMLRSEQYREWMFIVGNDGTEEERRGRGQEALKVVTGYKPQVGPSEVKDVSRDSNQHR